MSLIELIIFFIICGFAGYGFAAWQEDNEEKRKDSRRTRVSRESDWWH